MMCSIKVVPAQLVDRVYKSQKRQGWEDWGEGTAYAGFAAKGNIIKTQFYVLSQFKACSAH